MTFDPIRPHRRSDADPTAELISHLTRLRDRREQVAAASPLSRAVIGETNAGVYERLAPLIAELDPTWQPEPAASQSTNVGRHARHSSAEPHALDLDPVSAETFAASAPTAGRGNRNKVVTTLLKAANSVRRLRRRRLD